MRLRACGYLPRLGQALVPRPSCGGGGGGACDLDRARREADEALPATRVAFEPKINTTINQINPTSKVHDAVSRQTVDGTAY